MGTLRRGVCYVLVCVGVLHLLLGGMMLYRLHNSSGDTLKTGVGGGEKTNVEEGSRSQAERWVGKKKGKAREEPTCAGRRWVC